MLTVGDSNLPLQHLEKLWREGSLFPLKAHISVALFPARLGPKHASSPSPCPQRLQELNQSSVRMEGSTLQSAWQHSGKWEMAGAFGQCTSREEAGGREVRAAAALSMDTLGPDLPSHLPEFGP